MILDDHKLWILLAVGILICCYSTVKAADNEEDVINSAETIPETLAEDIQGHENASGRKVRQFGFPPPPPPPPFGYRPFGGPPRPPGYFGGGPGYGGGPGFGGGFQRTRVVTRTRTRVVNRYQGGGGGFYG